MQACQNFQAVYFGKMLVTFIEENLHNKDDIFAPKVWLFFRCLESLEFSKNTGTLYIEHAKSKP
jgi:hypothetical protein